MAAATAGQSSSYGSSNNNNNNNNSVSSFEVQPVVRAFYRALDRRLRVGDGKYLHAHKVMRKFLETAIHVTVSTIRGPEDEELKHAKDAARSVGIQDDAINELMEEVESLFNNDLYRRFSTEEIEDEIYDQIRYNELGGGARTTRRAKSGKAKRRAKSGKTKRRATTRRFRA